MAVDLVSLRDSLRQIVDIWRRKITYASTRKWNEFGKYAVWCEHFYSKASHNFLFEEKGIISGAYGGFDIPMGMPQVTVNLVYQMVDLFVPFMHYENPVRIMNDEGVEIPKELKLLAIPPDQLQTMMQQGMQQAADTGMPFDPLSLVPDDPMRPMLRAVVRELLTPYLNYTPRELDLVNESILTLTESLVMGAGVLWQETVETPRGKFVGSFHDSIDYLQIDPDFGLLRQSLWVSRERWEPKWVLEKRWPHLIGKLKPATKDHDRQAQWNIEGSQHRRPNIEKGTEIVEKGSHDMIQYFEIYSRCGIGAKLAGAPPELQERLGSLPDNIYLCVSPCCEYPLNLHPDMLEVPAPYQDEAARAIKTGIQWHTEYHDDYANPWPFVMLSYHPQRHSVWPISHVRPALGEQIMIDWIWSHVASLIKKSKRKWLYVDQLDSETMERVTSDMEEFVPVAQQMGVPIDKLIHHIPADPLPADMFQVAMHFERMFQMRTGTLDMLGGQQAERQMRSSHESQMMESYTKARPDAMAKRYADFMSKVARNEAIAVRRHIGAQDVHQFLGEPFGQEGEIPILGPLTQLWAEHVYKPDDIKAILCEYDYRVEADSMRKPNIKDQLNAMGESSNVVLPLLQADWQQTGDPTEINKWLKKHSELAKMPEIQLHDLRQAAMEMAAANGQDPEKPPPQKKAA
jgi:hypothetical protein